MFLTDYSNSKNKNDVVYQYAISQGQFGFSNITIENLTISVFSDALKVDGIRIPVSANVQAKIAEYYNCSLITSKIANLIFENKDCYVPPIIGSVKDMLSAEAIVRHSKGIDDYNPTGLVCNTGKHWILDINTPKGRATNYGWFFEGSSYQGIKGVLLGNYRVIQGKGTAHDGNHLDYSQTCVLVSRKCFLDGNEVDIYDVLKSDNYHLISDYKF